MTNLNQFRQQIVAFGQGAMQDIPGTSNPEFYGIGGTNGQSINTFRTFAVPIKMRIKEYFIVITTNSRNAVTPWNLQIAGSTVDSLDIPITDTGVFSKSVDIPVELGDLQGWLVDMTVNTGTWTIKGYGFSGVVVK